MMWNIFIKVQVQKIKTVQYAACLWVAILLMVSCSENEENHRLFNRVSALLSNKVDSALACQQLDPRPAQALALLDSMKNANMISGKKDRMRYLLLRTQAMNKAYIMLDTIKYMDEVVRYYERHGTNADRVQAYYMQGSVCRDTHDGPRALEYFKKALSCIDTTDVSCDFLQASYICQQMAALYSRERNFTEEIEIRRLALNYARKAKNLYEELCCQDFLICSMYLAGKKDSAIMENRKLYERNMQLGRRQHAAQTLLKSIDYHLKRKEAVVAKQMLEEIRRYSGLFDKEGNALPGNENYYYFAGDCHFQLSNIDSAVYYFRKITNYPKNIENLESGYLGLMECFLKLGQMDSVAKYAKLYTSANDTGVSRNIAEAIIQTRSLLDYNKSKQEAEMYRLRSEKDRAYAMVVIFFSLILATVAFWILRRQARFLKIQVLRKYRKILLDMHGRGETIKVQQQEINTIRERYEKDVMQLRKLHKIDEDVDLEDIDAIVRNHPIVKKFHQYSKEDVVPGENKWRMLYDLVEKQLPAFYKEITNHEYGLTTVEKKVCMLVRLGFPPFEIGYLLHLSPQHVSNVRSKINQKLFHQSGAKGLNEKLCQI